MSAELLLNESCPICGVTGRVFRLTRAERVRVRDIEVNVNRVLRKCEACDEEFENSQDHDWKLDAYAAYRKEKNFCTPDEVRTWRVGFELTQAEVARLLGWGEATLGRYESGALPTDAQHRALAGLMSPEGLAQALEDNPGALPDEKRGMILTKIHAEVARVRARQMLASVMAHAPDDVWSGNRAFDVWRTSALVSILARCGEFKTKLNKLLFYADFCAFRQLRTSISGLRYARIDYGPVPTGYETIYASLNVMNVVDVEPREVSGYSGEVIKSKSDAPIDVLSAQEIQIAERVRDFFDQWTATKTKNFSHRELAWKEVNNGDLIPYAYAEKLQPQILSAVSAIGRAKAHRTGG